MVDEILRPFQHRGLGFTLRGPLNVIDIGENVDQISVVVAGDEGLVDGDETL